MLCIPTKLWTCDWPVSNSTVWQELPAAESEVAPSLVCGIVTERSNHPTFVVDHAIAKRVTVLQDMIRESQSWDFGLSKLQRILGV